jgi:CRP-like cAMP-binding protein
MELLGGIRIFSDLGDDERVTLERICRWKEYAPDQQIVDRHGGADAIHFVVRGAARVVEYSLLGQEVTFDDLLEGSHFGEMAAVGGRPRSANVVAIKPSIIANMPARAFREALARYPVVATRVIEEMSRVVRRLDARIMDLSTLGATYRVYAELLRQATARTADSGSTAIRPIPVHGDIASRVSTTRETVARAMSELQRLGVVERTKDALLIHDLDRLEEIVEAARSQERRSGVSRRRDGARHAEGERRLRRDRRRVAEPARAYGA